MIEKEGYRERRSSLKLLFQNRALSPNCDITIDRRKCKLVRFIKSTYVYCMVRYSQMSPDIGTPLKVINIINIDIILMLTVESNKAYYINVQIL